MDKTDRQILAKIYACSITGTNPADTMISEGGFDAQHLQNRMDALRDGGLIKENGAELTEMGKSSLRVVLAGGVFDIIHPGHIHTLRAAKKLGDVLVVVVATDKTAKKMKKRTPLHSQDQRRDLVASLSIVDLCVIGQEQDIFQTVRYVNPQIIALGYDQVHQEKFITDGCKKLGLDVAIARLQSPVPEISSSKIEKEYGESIHGI